MNGASLRSVAHKLTGVDLSQEMLNKAKEKNHYDYLCKSEICEFLDHANGQFDLITCIDTLIYFGNLLPIFSKIYMNLKPNGWFIFTTEKLDPDCYTKDYSLDVTGRYSHLESYIARLLVQTGFQSPKIFDVIIRQEFGHPETGLLVRIQKS